MRGLFCERFVIHLDFCRLLVRDFFLYPYGEDLLSLFSFSYYVFSGIILLLFFDHEYTFSWVKGVLNEDFLMN